MSSVPWWLADQLEPGNIDVVDKARHPVSNPRGGYSTLYSMSVGFDDGETLIPQVVEGRLVSPEEAIKHYLRTKQHLGKFRTVEAANAAGEQLHREQEAIGKYITGDEAARALIEKR